MITTVEPLDTQDIALVHVNLTELTEAHAKNFSSEMQATLEEYKNIILDLRSLNYIDAVGIKNLLQLQQSIYKKNGRLQLTNVSAAVTTLLSFLDLHDFFSILPTSATEQQTDQPTPLN
jgi:anti-anti-sigma factor